MSDTVIRVENLSKRYLVSRQRRERYTALRDVMARGVKNFGKRILSPFTVHRSPSTEAEEFYALKDVSFEIRQGDRVGIIGRNGAGKSTLLKVLSRITEPSGGRIEIRGRVASLLEVGTGFHPELTGRENIYLNGAILGMTRGEIRHKFDEIVAFAEIEKFLDTPVKRYSSGMYVRLAFAVAAHLEPEILIVDEVLAVGDAQFQKKCLSKMEHIGTQGRTVLFVSHNMQAVKQLCTTAILLSKGRVAEKDAVVHVINTYVKSVEHSENSQVDGLVMEDEHFKFEDVRLVQNAAVVQGTITNGDNLDIMIDYRVKRPVVGLRVFFDLFDSFENLIFRTFHDENACDHPLIAPGTYSSVATIPKDVLGPIRYHLKIRAGIYNRKYCQPTEGISMTFDVINTGTYNRAYPGDPFHGLLAYKIDWRTREIA